MKITHTLLVVFAFVQISYQRSTPESDSYVAAVVEFAAEDTAPGGEVPTRINAARYIYLIDQAGKRDVDIIVFPEAGLTSLNVPPREGLEAFTTFIPPPSRNYIPCIESRIPVIEELRQISCSARKNNLYVVINIDEKVICDNETTCPTDKRLYYNTNVVFDREGKIIARYRKTNLYLEPGFNKTKIPEVVTFDTDFGVTFGTFTCFDILFKKPSMYLTRVKNITDIVFPTAWFSETPFLTAVQIQAAWAFADDVNFLTSGYNRPKFGNAGSGIYLGRQGIAKATMPDSKTTEMLVAEVPKKTKGLRNRPAYSYSEDEAKSPGEEEEEHWVHDELKRKRSVPDVEPKSETQIKEEAGISLFRENLTEYKSVPFNSSISQSLCYNDFCCDFNVEITNVDPSSNYHMIVFDGVRRFYEPREVGLYVCAVVLCSNDSVTSCGVVEKSQTTFNSISINATFPNYEELLITPNSLGEQLYPLSNWSYEDRYDEKKVHITATLGTPATNVVTCGIYARDFARDGPTKKSDSNTGMQWATLTALAIVSIFLLFLYRKGWRKPWQRNDPHSSEGHGPYQHLRIR